MGGGGELRFDYAMDMASPLPLSCGRLTRTAGAKVALAALAARAGCTWLPARGQAEVSTIWTLS